MRELLVDDHFQAAVESSSTEPLIVCGDFNSPSHLDWTNETRLEFQKDEISTKFRRKRLIH